MGRTVVWFSCGAVSAVAAKLTLETKEATIVYCDTSQSEHPDNIRFLKDIENWIGQEVVVIKSKDYESVDDVIEKTSHMGNIYGAPCTVEMKKRPRFDFQQADDIHVFGFAWDERSRIKKFRKNNPELKTQFILQERQVTKGRCRSILSEAGITLPTLYLQGFRNNNCLGCVKASSADYWNLIRKLYPEVFAKRVQQSKKLKVKLVLWKGERIFLHDLPLRKVSKVRENVSCGPDCNAPLLKNVDFD